MFGDAANVHYLVDPIRIEIRIKSEYSAMKCYIHFWYFASFGQLLPIIIIIIAHKAHFDSFVSPPSINKLEGV